METYSPNPLTAPPRHRLSLGSHSNDPTNPYRHSCQSRLKHCHVVDPSQVATNDTASTQDSFSSTSPSLTQQLALAVLQKYDSRVVLAWLTGFGSFPPDGTLWFQPGSLSAEDLEALSVLKDCPPGLVSSWLAFVRNGGWYPLSCTTANNLADEHW